MIPYRRISLIVGVALLGLLLALLVNMPTRVVTVTLLGQPWHLVVSGTWLVGFALSIWVYLGNDLIFRDHAEASGGWGYALTFWPLPGLLMFFGFPFLHTLPNPLFWIVGAILLALALAAILLGQYQAVAGASLRPATWFLSLAAYALAFGALLFLRQFSFPAPWLAVGMICGALALEILRQKQQDVRRTWGYGAVIGLLMTEIAWAVGYWALADRLLLTLYLFWSFYLLTSLAQQHLGGQLRRAAILEYVALAVAGFGLLWYFTPW